MAKILTLDDVKGLIKDGVVEVEAGTKFTPLAQDYISENGLEVREKTKGRTPVFYGSYSSTSPPKVDKNPPLDENALALVVEEVVKRLKERGYNFG